MSVYEDVLCRYSRKRGYVYTGVLCRTPCVHVGSSFMYEGVLRVHTCSCDGSQYLAPYLCVYFCRVYGYINRFVCKGLYIG